MTSALPSALKSPTPAIFQLVSLTVVTIAPVLSVVPFISHTATCPVPLCSQITSAFPLPSKSPTPAIFQLVSGTVGNSTGDAIVSPFMSHIAFSPVVLLRQMTSLLPSPLKSPRRRRPACCAISAALSARDQIAASSIKPLKYSQQAPLRPIENVPSSAPDCGVYIAEPSSRPSTQISRVDERFTPAT